MANYTICPKFIEFAGTNKNYIFDVLWVFIPDNSKKICIDSKEIILNEYDKIIENNKDLLDWYRYLTMRKELNFEKTNIDVNSKNLTLDICINSFDKILISDNKNNYKEHIKLIEKEGIEILDKDLAKVHLNYGDIHFSIKKSTNNIIVTKENVFETVKNICLEFKDLIEHKGLFKLLVNREDDRVPEKKAQLLFFGVAYSYCFANDLKLSPEVDSGNGPVDFNLSKGFKANVNVEMKIADSNKLENGLWSQLDIYNKAENTDKSVYLIIKTNDKFDKKIEKLNNVLNYRKARGEKLPEIVVIDSRFKDSASVRK